MNGYKPKGNKNSDGLEPPNENSSISKKENSKSIGTIIDELLNNPEVIMVQAGRVINEAKKAEEILKYIKTIEQKSIWGLYCYPKYECTLYKTQKGNFFVHVGKYVGNTNVSYQDKDKIELLSEKEVKEILNQLNEVETYKKIFNDLEEG